MNIGPEVRDAVDHAKWQVRTGVKNFRELPTSAKAFYSGALLTVAGLATGALIYSSNLSHAPQGGGDCETVSSAGKLYVQQGESVTDVLSVDGLAFQPATIMFVDTKTGQEQSITLGATQNGNSGTSEVCITGTSGIFPIVAGAGQSK